MSHASLAEAGVSGIPPAAVSAIVEAGRRLDTRGWVPASAGNFSVRLSPDRIAITRSGFHKGRLDAGAVMLVGSDGRALDATLRPSAETGLHCAVYRRFPAARAVLHGHSVPNTVLSRIAGPVLTLAGYELLKVFPGLPTHDTRVEVPVFANDQDIPRLAAEVERRWEAMAAVPPGYLIAGHGVYVWGGDMEEAWNRLEALEFMLACELEERRVR